MSRSSVSPHGRRAAAIFGVLAAVGLSACRDDLTPSAPRATPTTETSGARLPLDSIFAQASREFNVPADLLKAISYTETRVQMVNGQVEFDGVAAAKGLMALRGENLRSGAALAGVSVTAASIDPQSNVRAAAALLDQWARSARFDRSDLGAWAPLVATYSGIAALAGQAAYVQTDVYGALNRGVRPDGRVSITIEPRPTVARFTAAARPNFSADYAPAVWRPSPNYNSRPTGDIGKPAMIVIHTCEGGYTSCWSWLTNSSSGVSAHYVVNESGSEISQLVLEANRGWHIGATYDCSLNSSVECWRNGYSVNHFSVGVEHGGFASQTSFPAGQTDASAKLSCDISKGHAIPRDKYHVVAHGKLQPATRTDPGPNWPWTDYLNKISSYCNTSIIIDSNNNNNNTAVGYIEVSANWTGSSSTAGYYGSGYYYATTEAISDPATFWFYLPAAATKTIDGWWTSGSNRSTTAPFIAWNANGTKLGSVSVDQTINGGKWNALATYSFSAGWNKVQLSRWTTAGSVVIADAVRVR